MINKFIYERNPQDRLTWDELMMFESHVTNIYASFVLPSIVALGILPSPITRGSRR